MVIFDGLTEEENKSIEWVFKRTDNHYILGYYIDSSSSTITIEKVIFNPRPDEYEKTCKVVFLNNPNRIYKKFYGNFHLTHEKAIETVKYRYKTELSDLKKKYSLYS